MRNRAITNGIWELVNPAKPIKPIHILKPVEPTYTLPTETAHFDKEGYELHRAHVQEYKGLLVNYERQQKAFIDLSTYIQETLSIANAHLHSKSGIASMC